MDYDKWETYFNRGGDCNLLTISELSIETGCSEDEINELVYDGFFGDLYEGGYFDEQAVSYLTDYVEG